jgi:flavin-dependent dehydrogenase
MYDAIIVGARCAGSPTAMLLARKGYRILLVDRATFPSDTVSTHLIWQTGTAHLKQWGLLARVAGSNCPLISKVTFDFGEFALKGLAPPADGTAECYAPRRKILDKILVEAAVECGAEFREGRLKPLLKGTDPPPCMTTPQLPAFFFDRCAVIEALKQNSKDTNAILHVTC